jgi:2-polyprenyl-6-methoxyphenol hydroxylase-like FAD-dependent oxidoreductase
LIVGAGPVGLTLATDLAWHGIEVTVVERRPAARRGVPLMLLDLDAPDSHTLYTQDLVLVRPDRRGNQEPAAPLKLMDFVRGAGGATDLRLA